MFRLRRLTKSLRDENPATRARAVEELGKLGDPRAVNPLVHALAGDPDWHVRASAALALGELGDRRAVEPLMARVKDQNEAGGVRVDAASALGAFGDMRAFDVLKRALAVEPGPLGRAAARALLSLDRDAAFDFLGTTIDHRPERMRTAIEALGHLDDPRAVDLRLRGLVRLAGSGDPQERAYAARALGELGRPEGIEPLSRLLDDPHSVTKEEWDTGMPESWAAEAVFAPPGKWVDQTSYPVRQAAVRALEKIGGPEASRILEEYRSRSQ